MAILNKFISYKHAREIAIALRGMSIERTRVFLEDVIARKIAVPFRRHNNEVAHRLEYPRWFFCWKIPTKNSKRDSKAFLTI